MPTPSEPPPLNARRAIYTVMRDRARRSFCLHNYTPAGWWECDVFEVTASGVFREYEVKLTRADYAKDRKKAIREWTMEEMPEAERLHAWQTVRHVQKPAVTKHERLAARDTKGPSRFWYVAPSGLLRPEEIPEWAGLLELYDRGRDWKPRWRWDTRELVKAPQLHRQPCDGKTVAHARGIPYWRMHSLLTEAVD